MADTADTDIFAIMRTMRAMRRLRPDPVPDDLVARILEAGTCAPNGGNSQRWRFIVVRDARIKRAIQPYYRRAFEEVARPGHEAAAPAEPEARARHERQLAAVEYLTDHFHEAPVWIVACMADGSAPPTRGAAASIYPAVQNMLLAARALGLGATLTARHLHYEREVEAILGLPAGVHSYAIIPIGWPIGRFGPVRRAPLEEVCYADRWGTPYTSPRD